jgi:hypothetical protein
MTILADGVDKLVENSLTEIARKINSGRQPPPRMMSSATLNSGVISGTWATPTITIPPTNK